MGIPKFARMRWLRGTRVRAPLSARRVTHSHVRGVGAIEVTLEGRDLARWQRFRQNRLAIPLEHWTARRASDRHSRPRHREPPDLLSATLHDCHTARALRLCRLLPALRTPKVLIPGDVEECLRLLRLSTFDLQFSERKLVTRNRTPATSVQPPASSQQSARHSPLAQPQGQPSAACPHVDMYIPYT